MFFNFKKVVVSIVVAAILAPSVFLALPQSIEAYVPVDQKAPLFFDFTSKDSWWDVAAWAFAKIALSALAQMIVNWVRTGNQSFSEAFYGGAQTWILNFEQYLQDAANHAAGIFIGELLGPTVQNALCSPFRVPLTDYFRNTYGNGFPPFPHARCTLTQIVGNITDYKVDYSRGGNEALLVEFFNPSNNPVGALMVERERLEIAAARRTADARLESQSNQGFIGVKRCANSVVNDVTGARVCTKYETVTPGKAVQDQLAEALRSELKGFQHADEISEIIAQFIVSLAGALIQRGLNEGLGG